MLLLEYKIKNFLEDKRNIKEKLLDEFVELNKKDNLMRLAGMYQINRHKKWIHRAKYRRKNIKNLGYCRISWENIGIGKK